jgi:hypothetical protein
VREVAHDARVRELLQHARFTREACEVVHGRAMQHLERHACARVAIEGAVDATHAARTGQLFEDEALGDHVTGVHGLRSAMP